MLDVFIILDVIVSFFIIMNYVIRYGVEGKSLKMFLKFVVLINLFILDNDNFLFLGVQIKIFSIIIEFYFYDVFNFLGIFFGIKF